MSDITCLGNQGHHHYLTLVTDAYSKNIVSYDLSDSLTAQGAIRALKMVIKSRKELINHYDRGIQYCCEADQSGLAKSNVRLSMTQNGDPRENAIAERLNGTIKDEFQQQRGAFNTHMLRKPCDRQFIYTTMSGLTFLAHCSRLRGCTAKQNAAG